MDGNGHFTQADHRHRWTPHYDADSAGHLDPAPAVQFCTSWPATGPPSSSVSAPAPSAKRYVPLPELDLMARLAGLDRTARYGGWDHRPLTADSARHVSVYRPIAE
jgi:hypothetical protein